MTAEVDASRDSGGAASLAPDVSLGISSRLTLAIVHSTIARTGLRGSAAAGICVTAECAREYDNVGFEALWSLRDGTFAVAANGGLHVWSFTHEHHVAKLGARMRLAAGRLSIISLPSVTFAVSQRDAQVPNRDRLWLPVVAFYSIAPRLALGVGTGFKAPFDDVAGAYEVPLGLLAQVGWTKTVQVGASWVHGKALGGGEVVATGLASRALNVWVSAGFE